MEFQDLHAFFHVATQGGFSQAGLRLRVAQSALSRRVARLEHQLGVKLLSRHGRGVRLTEEGAALLDRAEGLMLELTQIERDVLVFAKEPTGHVRVAMPPTTSQILAPWLVAECSRLYPHVTLRLREGFSNLIHDWVLDGAVDLGLLYNPAHGKDLHVTPLLNEPLLLIAPAPTVAASPRIIDKQMDVDKLGILPLILPSHSHGLRIVVDRLSAEYGFPLHIVIEADGWHATKGLVAAGLGYSVFSYVGVHQEVENGTLRALPFNPGLNWQLALIRKQTSRTPRAHIEVERLIRQQIHVLLDRRFWKGRAIAES
jgi:LysR family nitrogen assimilation transcriptional regulator